MEEILIPAVALIALVKKFVDFGKAITNRNTNAIVTQLLAWVAGVVGVMLYAATAWADAITFSGLTLGNMNLASQFVIGLGIGSTASLVYDAQTAIDSADTAKTPPLIPGSPVEPVAVPAIVVIDT